MTRRFVPIGPKGRDLASAIEGRVGKHRCLYYDEGSLKALRDALGFGLHTRADGSEMQTYHEFKINGHVFRRKCREEAVGNFGVMWVTIGGAQYQLHEKTGDDTVPW